MNRNGPKRTQYKGENIIMQIMSKYSYNRLNSVCFYYGNIFCSIYPLIIAKKINIGGEFPGSAARADDKSVITLASWR